MPITDVMLDLETLGTRVENGVPILSIGWCCWDANAPWPTNGPYQASQLFVRHSACEVSFDTLLWWSDLPDAALVKILRQCARGKPLTEALAELSAMLLSLDKPRVWSHGSMFDVAILEYWYRKFGAVPPWKYWQVMDTRTIYALCGERLSANSHDAMADAINQAALVHNCWRRVKYGFSDRMDRADPSQQ